MDNYYDPKYYVPVEPEKNTLVKFVVGMSVFIVTMISICRWVMEVSAVCQINC